MATTMTAAEKNLAIKVQATGRIKFPDDMVQVGDFTFAIPVTVDGSERWAEVAFTAKNNKSTKVAPAYDPFEKAEEWAMEKEVKAKEKAAKEKAKADKVKAAKSKKSE